MNTGPTASRSELHPNLSLGNLDPFGILPAYMEVVRAWGQAPQQLQDRFNEFFSGLLKVQHQVAERAVGHFVPDFVPAVSYDERFQDKAWIESPWFDLLKEYYLLCTRAIEDAIYATPEVPEKTRRRAAFWARQALNAVSPSNFLWTNPIALTRFIATGGMSLAEGYKLWVNDLASNDIRMVDDEALTLGTDIAATPGQVVYRNDLMEVIQYGPATTQVRRTPVVIVAPWINKYYVLDLSPDKSLVRYLVNQGFTVFITSWKNPDGAMGDTRFDDYLTRGAATIIDVARAICGVDTVHAVGYCIGGTLLSALMAWYARGGGATPVSSWTLLTTLIDFDSPGDIDAFITDDGIRYIEERMAANGYLDGGEMGGTFRWLRPNSLIWRYVIHNYLYGEEPPPMDVLQWNVDCTRLPKAMHSFYLREFYLRNRLIVPDDLVLAGRAIDLRLIEAPAYVVGTEQDHIAPWKETFKIAGLVRGPVRYTLATSGHILGILSAPVTPPKRRYWSGDASGARDAEAWRTGIEKTAGSWWEDWSRWLGGQCGDLVAAREPGSAAHPPLAAAPGTYVLEK
jgi:polyhydroxyalkanoate synthase